MLSNILLDQNSSQIKLVVQRFSKVCDFFRNPLHSSYLSIVLASDLTGRFETVSLSQVDKKLVSLPYKEQEGSFVLIPFCHDES